MPRVIALARTGDRIVDEQARRMADALAAEVNDVTTLAGAGDGGGTALVTAETVSWAPLGAGESFYVQTSLLPARTVDATAETVVAVEVPEGRVCRFTASVTGRRTTNGDAYTTEIAAAFDRDAGGAPVQIGATTVVASHIDAGAAAWLVDFDVVANAVRLRVTGQAATEVRWSAWLTVHGGG